MPQGSAWWGRGVRPALLRGCPALGDERGAFWTGYTALAARTRTRNSSSPSGPPAQPPRRSRPPRGYAWTARSRATAWSGRWPPGRTPAFGEGSQRRSAGRSVALVVAARHAGWSPPADLRPYWT